MGVSAPTPIGLSGRHAVHAGAEHGVELANLQWPWLHWRNRVSKGRMVPSATRAGWRASKALRDRHGEARARHGRFEDRQREGFSSIGSARRCFVLFKF